MRPKSIVNFEFAVLAWIVTGIVGTWVSWSQMVAQAVKMHSSGNVVLIVQVVIIAIFLILMWLIAHKGSAVAKWIYTVLSAILLVAGIYGAIRGGDFGTLPLVLNVVRLIALALSLWFLFRPESSAWFAEGRGPDPEALP
jgi:hypothetical protein